MSIFIRGNMAWIKYNANGKVIRESSGSPDRKVAQALLTERRANLHKGIAPPPQGLKVSDLLNELLADYKMTGKRSVETLAIRIDKHILPTLGQRKAAMLNTGDVRRYITTRQAEGAANGSINRELAALRRAYRIAVQEARLAIAPHIPQLREAPARTGFLDREQFEAVRAGLPIPLQPVVTFLNITGWRVRSEVLPLQWRQVDFGAGTVRLDAGTTKNGEGRLFPFTTELRTMLEAQKAYTEAVQRKCGIIVPNVFHRDGVPIKDFHRAWKTVCRKVGVPGRLLHDFRRVSCRNLIRAGVSEHVAMTMMGWRSHAMLARYNVINEGDLRDAASKLDNALANH